jgi:hypothetical protein
METGRDDRWSDFLQFATEAACGRLTRPFLKFEMDRVSVPE